EELAADERRDGVPGQAEDERVASYPERDRLSRLDRDAPEHLLDAELALDRADEIVLADRDSAGGHEDIGAETPLERRPQRLLVVRCRRLRHYLCAGRLERRGEHEAVRLVDLPRAKGFSRRNELAAGREHCDARDASARECVDTRRCRSGNPSRSEPAARRYDDLSRGHVSARRT